MEKVWKGELLWRTMDRMKYKSHQATKTVWEKRKKGKNPYRAESPRRMITVKKRVLVRT